MARKASRGHKSALQSPCGCRVERLDAKDVPERQCVCGYPNKGDSHSMKWVVTGINKLTGEREPVTKPHSEWKAREMRDKLAARQHCKSAYKWLKVEPAEREGDLW